MASEAMVLAIVNAATIVLPSVIGLIKSLTAQQNPELPPPTDAEVLMAFDSVVMKSLAADDAWLAAHPKA